MKDLSKPTEQVDAAPQTAAPQTGAPHAAAAQTDVVSQAGTPAAPTPRGRRTPTQSEIRQAFETGEYPYRTKLRRQAYEVQKAKLQAELLKVQKWASETGQKFVMLFEGRDAAGKGGTIKRFMEHLNPREARVVALNKPTDHERGQWYFQRYVEHLPTAGEIVLYDRSWYNRAGVEAGDGLLRAQRLPRIHASDTRPRTHARPVGHPALQILVLGHAGGAEAPLRQPRA